MKNRKLAPELLPVLNQLQNEGFKVYSYNYKTFEHEEIRSLWWFENGRMLNIQVSLWYNYKYARNRFDLLTSYIPSRENGSCCGLLPESFDMGVHPSELLKYRNSPTWVKGYKNYSSLESFLKSRPEFFELDSSGCFVGVKLEGE